MEKDTEIEKVAVENPNMLPSSPTASPMRQIVIETNGNDIKLVSAQVSGKIELIAVLQNLITFLMQQK